jgi:O-antigen/teichoic acid export membrane protein
VSEQPISLPPTETGAGDVGVDVADSAAADKGRNDTVFLAIRNALTLGGALMLTWSIGLSIRVAIPRHLGPTAFGTISWADAFTLTIFIILSLGLDPYIRKEVAVRPEHASDFYGGAVLVRVVMTLCILAGLGVFLHATHRSVEVSVLVLLYALAQFAAISNGTLGAMLHAKGRVRGSSALSIATKVIWAVGVLGAFAMNAPIWAYGAAYFASEAVEVVVLTQLARKHLGLVFRVDPAATLAMLKSSLPYSIAGIAATAYGSLGASMLEFTGGSKEVGLYNASFTLANLTLLMSPILGWVLTPMLARAATQSRAAIFEHTSRTMELVLTMAIPASMLINLGASTWVHVVFGAPFANAALALRVMSTLFVLTYMAIIYSGTLVVLERAWALTWISVGGLVVNATCNLVFVHYSGRMFGEGGAGAGCAAAMLGTEMFVCAGLAIVAGPAAFDRRCARTVLRGLFVYAVVAVVHVLLSRTGHNPLAVDLALYLVLAMAIGALRPKEMIATVREAIRRRRG